MSRARVSPSQAPAEPEQKPGTKSGMDSRTTSWVPAGTAPWAKPADDLASFDPVRVAEEIGMEALGMAQWARAAGMPTLGYLLETVALEAGAQVSALQWPNDAPKP